MSTSSNAISSLSHPESLGVTSRQARWFDIAERVIILAFYVGLVSRLVLPILAERKFGNLLLLPSEGLVVLFVLIRRSTVNVSQRWQDWGLAFAATAAPMMVESRPGAGWIPDTVASSLMLMGIWLQVHAKISLGRSFGCIPANRGVKLSGPYRLIRHPMYAGYLLSHIAYFFMNPSVYNLLAYAICYALQTPRLLAEERLLASDPQYAQYMGKVRYRLLPFVF